MINLPDPAPVEYRLDAVPLTDRDTLEAMLEASLPPAMLDTFADSMPVTLCIVDEKLAVHTWHAAPHYGPGQRYVQAVHPLPTEVADALTTEDPAAALVSIHHGGAA